MYNFVTFYCGLNSKSNKNEIIIILYRNKLQVLKNFICLDVFGEGCAIRQNFELLIDNGVYINFVNLLLVTWNPLTPNILRAVLFVQDDNKIRAYFNNMVICILDFYINIRRPSFDLELNLLHFHFIRILHYNWSNLLS